MNDFRLVYYSENRIPIEKLEGEIETILTASRKNNILVGISGALMFNAGYFAQVLEGNQPAIESTFERIQQDRRHGNVQLLEFAAASTRAFQSWSMAFIGLPGGIPSGLSTVASRSGFDPRNLDGVQLFSRLQNLLNDPQ
ncbi:BLUF domain-containing protein [Rhizobium wenxiniae]|uniref:BLUF domain-containing protein n=1 Tax=Rhizobium wenxiniae TaxID=1737357 RepID=UPI003C16579D